MCRLRSTPTRPFVGPSRLLAGKGASSGSAGELRALGVVPVDGRVLVVGDSAVLDLGLHRRAVTSLEDAGYRVLVAPGVAAEPTPDSVRSLLPKDGTEVAAVLAIGGGSALDAGKLVSAALSNPLDLTAGLTPAADIMPGPPIVAVPTTAGTGAEVTAVAMLWHDGGKRMFVHPHLVPRGVLIDPELLLGLPQSVTASAGFDALGHAAESLLSTFRTPVTVAAAREALTLLSVALPAAYENGDLESRYGTALGAYQAGLALNASVVLGHSLAYAIASRTGLPHGVTVAMALPYCLAHARPAGEEQIADMAEIVCGRGKPELFVRWVVEHSRQMGIPTSLQELGVPRAALPAMAADCVESYPRPNHPVPIDHAGVLALLERMHDGEPYEAWEDSFLPPSTARPSVTTLLPEQLEVRNPADVREVVGTVPSMDARGVHAAFESAERAAAAWRDTSQVDRGRVLLRASGLLRDRRDELARTLTLEMGKTLAEASGEVGKAADFFEYYGGLGRAERGVLLSHENPDVMSWTVHEPLGVVLAITPWNDPLLTPARKLAPALAAGNAVVLKPASDTPVIAIELARVLSDAGLPPGVLNVVTGAGRRIGESLLEHPALKAVSFTGSNDVGDSLKATLALRDVRLLAELGGKNAAVVLADADLDRAIANIAGAAFAQAGQRCTATSRVLVQRDVFSAVRDGLVRVATAHVLGPGVDPSSSMGPLVSATQRSSVLNFVERALSDGATRATPTDWAPPSEHGCYVAPTVLTDVHPSMEIWTDEVFGPVVALVEFDSLDEAVELVNASQFGLAAAIYTSDLDAAHAFAGRADVGQVAVNLPTSGWDVHMPFGGFKASGSGHKEQGLEGLDFYRKTKTVAMHTGAR